MSCVVKTICIIACHGGPADHFAQFAESLPHPVTIYASAIAAKKFAEKGIAVNEQFDPEKQEEISRIANLCMSSTVLVDVGDPFTGNVLQELAEKKPEINRLAYYDNPEPYVPGGYFETATKVMSAANKVLFANSRLATMPAFNEFTTVGIGYYPMAEARACAQERALKKVQMQKNLLESHGIQTDGKKILVYFGGNNSVYFDEAFPKFLSLLTEGIGQKDLSRFVIVLQQHPRAKGANIDKRKLDSWLCENQDKATAPKIIVSDYPSSDAQVFADKALYYQTSMGPQFALAGIPTIQVGHERFDDILIRNGIAPCATDVETFLSAIFSESCAEVNESQIMESLGIRENWQEVLTNSF